MVLLFFVIFRIHTSCVYFREQSTDDARAKMCDRGLLISYLPINFVDLLDSVMCFGGGEGIDNRVIGRFVDNIKIWEVLLKRTLWE